MDPKEAGILLDGIRKGFLETLEHAEEKVALAEHIHSTVYGHICKLEDDLKHFEEEIRLAKQEASHRTVAHSPPAIESAPAPQKGKNKRARSKDDFAEEPAAASTASGRKRSRAISLQLEQAAAVTHPSSPPKDSTGVEQTYCYCGQPAFGEMIGCDANEDCEIEWFHYGCVGLTTPPKDHWYCPDCTKRMAREALPNAMEAESAAVEPEFV